LESIAAAISLCGGMLKSIIFKKRAMKITLTVILSTVFGMTAFGQSLFTKVMDATNPIVSFAPVNAYAGASWIDYDKDGHLDLFANPEFLFHNNGDGTFTQVPQSQHGINSGSLSGDIHDGHTWGDFDNDGWIDVYLANRTSALFRNNHDGTFSKVEGVISTGVNGWAAAWGDYDKDSYLDLMVTHPCGFIGACHGNWLFKSDGAGGFTSESNDVTTGFDAYTVGSWSDFDQDGDLDLFIGSGEVAQLSPDNIYFNQLAETGTATLLKSTCAGLCTDPRDGQNWNWIDYDNDGDLDGFVTNYTKANDFYRNDGGTFTKLTPAILGADMASVLIGNWLTNVWADFDNDGDLDLYLGNDNNASDFLYLNDGDGTFTKTTQAFSYNAANRGASAGDYDNDGDVDLFILASNAAGKGLYQNNGNGNTWANFELTGAVTNRSAIGTKVRAKAIINGVAVWQMREISSQNSFCGANDLRVHFGLKDAQRIDSLIVDWPIGLPEVYTNIQVNQFCKIMQGGGSTCAIATAVKEVNKPAIQLSITPNPSYGEPIQLTYHLDRRADVLLQIINAEGKTYWKDSFPNTLTDTLTVHGKDWPTGTYFIKLQAGEHLLTQSFILAR